MESVFCFIAIGLLFYFFCEFKSYFDKKFELIISYLEKYIFSSHKEGENPDEYLMDFNDAISKEVMRIRRDLTWVRLKVEIDKSRNDRSLYEQQKYEKFLRVRHFYPEYRRYFLRGDLYNAEKNPDKKEYVGEIIMFIDPCGELEYGWHGIKSFNSETIRKINIEDRYVPNSLKKVKEIKSGSRVDAFIYEKEIDYPDRIKDIKILSIKEEGYFREDLIITIEIDLNEDSVFFCLEPKEKEIVIRTVSIYKDSIDPSIKFVIDSDSLGGMHDNAASQTEISSI